MYVDCLRLFDITLSKEGSFYRYQFKWKFMLDIFSSSRNCPSLTMTKNRDASYIIARLQLCEYNIFLSVQGIF